MTSRTYRIFLCDVPECAASATGTVPQGWVGGVSSKHHRCSKHANLRCSGCGRTMRRWNAKASDYPNTVKQYTATPPLCVNCQRGKERVTSVLQNEVATIRRLVEQHLDDPDDRLLVMDTLGLIGGDV